MGGIAGEEHKVIVGRAGDGLALTVKSPGYEVEALLSQEQAAALARTVAARLGRDAFSLLLAELLALNDYRIATGPRASIAESLRELGEAAWHAWARVEDVEAELGRGEG